MRKRIALTSLAVAGLLAACGNTNTGNTGGNADTSAASDTSVSSAVSSSSESQAGESTGKLTVWTHPFTEKSEEEKQMWDEVVSGFEDEYNVDVTFQQIPWANRDQKILTALSSNQGPDVFYLIPDQLTQFASEGILSSLSGELDDDFLSDFDDVTLQSATYDDELYGLPILQDVTSMIYNEDIVKDIGGDPENLPKTWEEFSDWAEKAKEKGYYALGFDGGGSMNGTFYPLLWQAGGNVVTPDGDVEINSEDSKKAFEFLNEMYAKGYIAKDSVTSTESNALFESGKLLAIQGTGIMINNLETAGDINYIVSPPLKEKEQKTYGTTGVYVTPVNSKNKVEAVDFIKYVTDTDTQRKFNTLANYIPTRNSAKDILEGRENIEKVASYSEYAVPGVLHPKGRTIMPFVQAEIQSMLTGEKTPEEAADAAAKAIQAELDKP